jgi:hypothetical protein
MLLDAASQSSPAMGIKPRLQCHYQQEVEDDESNGIVGDLVKVNRRVEGTVL